MAKETVKLQVKTGDRVMVTAGKDKGKIGNIKKVVPSENQVFVEGANLVTKAQKANPMAGVQGGLVKIEAALDASNVMVICPKCEKPTRIKHTIVDGKKVRVCKKCGEQLDV
ncbi:MAG: 50S ribosomal protein L24 [bacterium]|nr:50S ribosomal protein L24 [bacterium]